MFLTFLWGKKCFWYFRGEEILVRERLGDVFRGKCTYLWKKKVKNVKFDVKFKNLGFLKKGH